MESGPNVYSTGKHWNTNLPSHQLQSSQQERYGIWNTRVSGIKSKSHVTSQTYSPFQNYTDWNPLDPLNTFYFPFLVFKYTTLLRLFELSTERLPGCCRAYQRYWDFWTRQVQRQRDNQSIRRGWKCYNDSNTTTERQLLGCWWKGKKSCLASTYWFLCLCPLVFIVLQRVWLLSRLKMSRICPSMRHLTSLRLSVNKSASSSSSGEKAAESQQ